MTIPNPEHLFEQAEQLLTPPGSGRPRQTDLRRAVSNAYYAVLHSTLAAAADHVVGRGSRTSAHYGLVYRSANHRTLRDVCRGIQNLQSNSRYRQYRPQDGFDPHIEAFAQAVVDLQIRREEADYDPLAIFKRSDVRSLISLGRTAIRRFEAAPEDQREIFLGLLLFPTRS